MPATVRTSTPVHYGTPRIAAAREYVARMVAVRDSIERQLDDVIDGECDAASERAADWYTSRLVCLEHDIERLRKAIRRECARTGEAVLP